jgi:thermitase
VGLWLSPLVVLSLALCRMVDWHGDLPERAPDRATAQLASAPHPRRSSEAPVGRYEARSIRDGRTPLRSDQEADDELDLKVADLIFGVTPRAQRAASLPAYARGASAFVPVVRNAQGFEAWFPTDSSSLLVPATFATWLASSPGTGFGSSSPQPSAGTGGKGGSEGRSGGQTAGGAPPSGGGVRTTSASLQDADSMILCLQGGLSVDSVLALLLSNGLDLTRELSLVDCSLVRVAPGTDVSALASALRGDPRVRDALPNFLRTVFAGSFDPLYPLQATLRTTRVPQAWDAMTAVGTRTKVAVLDTGFDLLHPDLVSVWRATAATAGLNVLTNPEHGTEVAGVLAALGDNAYGIAGVNKKWADLLLVKVFGDVPASPATDADILEGIDIAVRAGARVVNMSFGGPQYDPLLCEAMERSTNVLFVAAAGNSGDTIPNYPAACAGANVLSVGSTNSADRIASDSSRGSWVDVAAPGVDVLTTEPGSLFTIVSGTSFAAPHAAGVASMLLAEDPQMTAAEARSVLIESADSVALPFGTPRLNACRALGACL